jgi:2-oxoglutarate dehydrogenase E1 component
MSELTAYDTGGTIHVVINNQVGFTTDFTEARSSNYCTDISQILEAPQLHVNGDDAEAVAFAMELAAEYRQKFQKDIFIDILCYRRHGHNESDEPRFTQPVLYKTIEKHRNPRDIYAEKLMAEGVITKADFDKLDADFRNFLQERLNYVRNKPIVVSCHHLEQEWMLLRRAEASDFEKSPMTGITQGMVEKIANAITTLPEGFKPLKQIEKTIEDRKKQIFVDKKLNWASAELLAYGSILAEGKIVRMTGQDVQRGTFSHRHAVVRDAETNEPYNFLSNITPEQKYPFMIHNSLLSEYGVLGFEFGYALTNPHALVIWEAQFGDFANGAQIMIDQFITSAESKWQKMNGLVMLLPHGYEGQGPEHSNARPERFLQLAAENNIVVANCTTPANIFHLMRRQLAWEFRKPTVVMSPKSLLRHPLAVSPLEEFTSGSFREVYEDDYVKPVSKVRRVLLCSGKVYYDLLAKQQEAKIKDVAIIRVEQLHPFPTKQVKDAIAKYKNCESIYWVQEEPENMGAWTYFLRLFHRDKVLGQAEVIARKASASPATGFNKLHVKEQTALVERAFAF